MNTLTTILPTPAPSLTPTKTILVKAGFQCSILTLAPGDETPRREAGEVEEHLLFVIEGHATVRAGDINTMIKQDDALLIPKGMAHLIAAGPTGWVRILRVDAPPRRDETPRLVTLDPGRS